MTLPDRLALLEANGLIRLASAMPELEYIFRHSLTRDAAYNSLLLRQRRDVHRATAEAILALCQPDGQAGAAIPDALAPILAHHYATAGDAPRALQFYVQAGEAAFARYANTEAAAHLAQAVALALQTDGVDPAQLRHLFTRLGRAYELSAKPEAALRVYAQMEAAAVQRSDRALQLAALMARATALSTASYSFDEAGSQSALEQARGLARELDDHAAEAHINWTLLLRNTMLGGDPHERLALGQAALTAARALGLQEQLAYVLTDMWFAFAGLGLWDEALDGLVEAAGLWRALGNPAMLSEALTRTGVTNIVRGNHVTALKVMDEAYAVAEQMDSPQMRSLSRAMAGTAHLERGQLAAALEVMPAAIAQGEQTGNITALIGTRAELAVAYGFIGQVDTGLALAQQAEAAGRQFELLRPWAMAAAARLHARRGDHAAAEAALAGTNYDLMRRRIGFMAPLWGNVGLAQVETALCRGDAAQAAALAGQFLSTLQANQIAYLQPEVLLVQGRALLALGQLPLAREALESAHAKAVALGARRHLAGIFAAMAQVAAAENMPAEAARLRAAKRVEIEWLAGQLPLALRTAFLAYHDAD